MAGEAADAERTAVLLGDKLGMLQSTLKAVAAGTPLQAWRDPSLMTHYLKDKRKRGLITALTQAA